MALDPQFRKSMAAVDLLELAATHEMKAFPTNNKYLERIRDLKTKNIAAGKNSPRASEIYDEMMVEALAYLASGETLKDARFAYYRTAIVYSEDMGRDLIAMGKGKKYDLNRDGNISINEVSRVMSKAGVTSWPDFDKDQITSAVDVDIAVSRAEGKKR